MCITMYKDYIGFIAIWGKRQLFLCFSKTGVNYERQITGIYN